MASGSEGQWYRDRFRDISGTLIITAATGDTILAATDTNLKRNLFIQRVIVYIQTDAAQSISFEDTAGTPVQIAKVDTSPGAGSRWDFDFGPIGVKLTQAKNFNMNVSAAGLVGVVVWYGYDAPALVETA